MLDLAFDEIEGKHAASFHGDKCTSGFSIHTDCLKTLGHVGILRANPRSRESQLDGVHSLIRYHLLRLTPGELRLLTTDTHCFLSSCCAVTAPNDMKWSVLVDSKTFNKITAMLSGPTYEVVREYPCLLFHQQCRNLRLPIRSASVSFACPPAAREVECHRVARKPLLSAIAFLAGVGASTSASITICNERRNTVSLFSDGFAIAHCNGVDRIAEIPSNSNDIHVATDHARRLAEWLTLWDSDVDIAVVNTEQQNKYVYLAAEERHHEIWLPLQSDSLLREKTDHVRNQSPNWKVKINRRCLWESVKLLGSVASGRRIILRFRKTTDGHVGVHLQTHAKRPDGASLSCGEAEHEGDGVLDIQGYLELELSSVALEKELRRTKSESIWFVYWENAKCLAIEPTMQNIDGEGVKVNTTKCATRSLFHVSRLT